MRGVLAASTAAELDPILVADVDGVLFLVDGHHRLRAYSLEKRQTVPARVLKVTRKQALIVSKLVNLDGSKLPMHNEQRKDAVWQYLAEVTLRGMIGLPAGQSQRSLAARFGVSLDTVQRMLAKLPEVDPTGFPEDSLDAGTRWPRWKHVRVSRFQGMQEAMPPDVRHNWKKAKAAKKFFKLLEEFGSDVLLEALQDAAADASGGHAEETLKILQALEGDEPDF